MCYRLEIQLYVSNIQPNYNVKFKYKNAIGILIDIHYKLFQILEIYIIFLHIYMFGVKKYVTNQLD